MLTSEIIRMLLTHSSTAKQEEKQEERGSCQTLAETKKELLAKVGWIFKRILKGLKNKILWRNLQKVVL